MSEGTVYNVKTVYSTQTSGAVSALDRLGSMFDRLGGLLGGLKNMLLGLPSLVVAAFATGALGAFMQRVMALGGAAETSRLAMAGMINAQMFTNAAAPAGDFQRSLVATDALVERMRVHARELPGSFEDLQAVMQGSLSGGLSAGQSIGEIEQMASRVMSVTKGFGIASEQASLDMAAMMAGRARMDTATFSRLAPLLGQTAGQFNAMSAPERWQAISRALAGFDPMIEAYASSWDAVSSTTKDHLEGLLRVGTAPLFEKAKTALAELNTWIEANQASLRAFAQIAGRGLTAAFSRVVEVVRELPGLLQRIAANPLIARLIAVASGLGGRVASMMMGAGGGGISAASGAAAGIASGIPGLGLAIGALAVFATHSNAVSATLGHLSGVFDSAVAVALRLWHVFVGVEGFLGGFLVGVLPGLSGGLETLAATVRDVIDRMGPAVTELLAALTPAVTTLGSALGGLASMIAVTAQPAVERLAGEVGSLGSALAIVIRWVNRQMGGGDAGATAGELYSAYRVTVNTWFDDQYDGLRYELTGLGHSTEEGIHAENLQRNMVENGLAPSIGDLVTEFDPRFVRTSDELARLDAQQNAMMSTPQRDTLAGLTSALSGMTLNLSAPGVVRFLANPTDPLNQRLNRTTPARGNTHVTNNVQVHQTIEQADDPDRVLIATRDAVLQAMLHPVESHSALVTR